MSNTKHNQNEEEARRIIQEQESSFRSDENFEDSERDLEKKRSNSSKVEKLGRVEMFDEERNVIDDIGWIRVKPETIPSRGVFYPEGTEITIRAASAGEIRHWSTLDEDDLLSIDDSLNRIVDKCCKVKFPRQYGSYKDLKEIDRFFIVFAIREYTFKRGENSLNVTFSCDCGKTESVPMRKEMLSYFEPSEDLMSRFSNDERCFHLKLKNGEELRLYMPSLGVMMFIKTYITEKNKKNEEYDKPFLRWAPFLFPDWKMLNMSTYNQLLQESYAWSIDKISVLGWFVDKMQKSVNSNLKYECSGCGAEVEAPINFPGGIKSLFLISDPTSKLL